jgi:hypothetical protein
MARLGHHPPLEKSSSVKRGFRRCSCSMKSCRHSFSGADMSCYDPHRRPVAPPIQKAATHNSMAAIGRRDAEIEFSSSSNNCHNPMDKACLQQGTCSSSLSPMATIFFAILHIEPILQIKTRKQHIKRKSPPFTQYNLHLQLTCVSHAAAYSRTTSAAVRAIKRG